MWDLDQIKKLKFHLICLSSVFFTLANVYSPAVYADPISLTQTSENESTWQLIKKKLRVRTFSEFMTPSLNGESGSVPRFNGRSFSPTSIFHIFWTDYEIAPHYRVVYWQRMLLFLNSNIDFQGIQFLPRHPRFAIRRTEVFDVPQLSTTYDLFVQYDVDNYYSTHNSFEVGIRTNTSYAFPQSHWSLGMIQEYTTSYLTPNAQGNMRAYGWFMPWVSYEINSKFSTQHYVTMPFQNMRNAPWTTFIWDDPGMPYTQNGISMNVSETVWASVFINNYLLTAPTLQNTWASLWLSLTFL